MRLMALISMAILLMIMEQQIDCQDQVLVHHLLAQLVLSESSSSQA